MLLRCGLYLKLSFLIIIVPLSLVDATSHGDQFTIHKQPHKYSKIKIDSVHNPAYLDVEQEQELEYYHDHPPSHPAYSLQGNSWNTKDQQSQNPSSDTLSEIQAIKDLLQTKPNKSDSDPSKNFQTKYIDINIPPIRFNEYGSFLENIYQKVAKKCREESSSTTEQLKTTFNDVDQRNVTNKGNHVNEIHLIHFIENNDKNDNMGVNKAVPSITNKPSNTILNICRDKNLDHIDPNGGLGKKENIPFHFHEVSGDKSYIANKNTHDVPHDTDRETVRNPTLNWSLGKKEKKPMYLIVHDDSDEHEIVKNPPTNHISGINELTPHKDMVVKPPEVTSLKPIERSPQNNFFAQNSFNGNSMRFKVNLNVFPNNRGNGRETSTKESLPNNYYNTHIVTPNIVFHPTDMIENHFFYLNTDRIPKTDKERAHQNKNSIENQCTSYPKNISPIDSTTNSARYNEGITKNPIATMYFDEKNKNHLEVKIAQQNVDLLKKTVNPKDQDIAPYRQVHQPWMVAALSYIQQGKSIPEGLKRFIAIKGGIIPGDVNIQSTTAIPYIRKQSISASDPFEKSPQRPKITSKLPPLTADKTTTETAHTYANTNSERRHFKITNVEKQSFSASDSFDKSPQREKVTNKLSSITDKSTTPDTLKTYENIDPEKRIYANQIEGRPHFNPHWLHRGANLYSTVPAVPIENAAVNVEKVDVLEVEEDIFIDTVKNTKTTEQIEPKLKNTRKSCGSNVKPVVVTTIERSNYISKSDNRFVHFRKTGDEMNRYKQ